MALQKLNLDVKIIKAQNSEEIEKKHKEFRHSHKVWFAQSHVIKLNGGLEYIMFLFYE